MGGGVETDLDMERELLAAIPLLFLPMVNRQGFLRGMSWSGLPCSPRDFRLFFGGKSYSIDI